MNAKFVAAMVDAFNKGAFLLRIESQKTCNHRQPDGTNAAKVLAGISYCSICGLGGVAIEPK